MSGWILPDAIWIFGCTAAGYAAARLGICVFNAVPAGWLCDYGETPGPELTSGKRISSTKAELTLWAIFCVSFFLFHRQYSALSADFYLVCLAGIILVLTAVSDSKYEIIPDQFVLALLVPGIGNLAAVLITRSMSPADAAVTYLLGAVCGGGLWILLDLLGKLIYRKEGAGYGDVKLFAALGLLCGLRAILLVFIAAILIAAFHFAWLLIRKKIDGSHYKPMGPYICAAAILYLAFRSQAAAFVRWYFSGLI